MREIDAAALRFSAHADQSQLAARHLVTAMFDVANDIERQDLLTWFAQSHDFAAGEIRKAWGDPGKLETEDRLQLHCLAAGSAYMIQLVNEYLQAEAGR